MNDDESLVLLPETVVRRRLSGRALSFRVLVPPYAAYGVGVLRVLRVREGDERTDIVAGYEQYVRAERPAEAGASASRKA